MSIFLPDHKALFLHIPRTGGTWVERNLNAQTKLKTEKWYGPWRSFRERKHTVPTHIVPIRWSRMRFAFTFVRYPVDYYESQWRWLTKRVKSGKVLRAGNPRTPWNSMKLSVMEYSDSFDLWVEAMLKNHPCWVTRLFEQYVGPDGNGGESCHFIGRTETLADDFVQILELFGHEIDQTKLIRKKVNTAKVKPAVVWSKELRERVEYDERSLIRRFFGLDTFNTRTYCLQDDEWNRVVNGDES